MPRRTKAQAEQTRSAIIDAARKVFGERGVSRTTMEHIAVKAGVTRGAIYWHFANKSALFSAMRDQVRLPLLDRMNTVLHDSDGDPLDSVEHLLCQMLDGVARNRRTRETYAIMTFKCEYVAELEPVLAQMTSTCQEMLDKLEEAYQSSATRNLLREGMAPRLAALETFAFVSGLMRMWLADGRGRVVRKQVRELIAAHVATRRRT